MLSTRAQILDAAHRLFARQGYQHTSIREIAEQLGLTKTAVLYHFPSKADILAALAEPFLDDLQRTLSGPGTREETLEALLDVYLRHRFLLRTNLVHDLALLAQDAVVRRFTQLMLDANKVIAGPAPDMREKVRAAQAVAMLSDPVIAHADEPPELLRAEVLRGVRLLYQ
ncbi:MAG: TetR family transcriptional regulator [Actinophytocola sp.]|uniref:TetR/AcrR family transcriptional regulator n=1 Tax=Actinophytocola sp. TaxID=1872138 RepID=UPI00132625AB|nr:TetR/AcrR family transcriptional regulator [Actinophytocola sp.]MPZ80110.1 TetR family transcriptional regulator [Actinophytocola sp.]